MMRPVIVGETSGKRDILHPRGFLAVTVLCLCTIVVDIDGGEFPFKFSFVLDVVNCWLICIVVEACSLASALGTVS